MHHASSARLHLLRGEKEGEWFRHLHSVQHPCAPLELFGTESCTGPQQSGDFCRSLSASLLEGQLQTSWESVAGNAEKQSPRIGLSLGLNVILAGSLVCSNKSACMQCTRAAPGILQGQCKPMNLRNIVMQQRWCLRRVKHGRSSAHVKCV